MSRSVLPTGLRRLSGVLLLSFAAPNLSPAQLINEIDASSAGRQTLTSNDEITDFVELSGTPGASLDGLSLVLLDGAPANDPVVSAVDLTGFSVKQSGLFVIGSFGTPHTDMVLSAAGQGPLQLGPDGTVLYDGAPPALGMAASSLVQTAANTSDDLLDAAAYTSVAAQDSVLRDILTPGNPHVFERNTNDTLTNIVVQSASRIPPNPDSPGLNTTNYQVARATPGTANPTTPLAEAKFLTFYDPASPSSADGIYPANQRAIPENGGSRQIRVFRTAPQANLLVPVVVTLHNRDVSEISFRQGASSITSITIAGGQTASEPFDVVGVNDGWLDGNQWAYFWGSAPNYSSAAGWIEVTDEGSDAAGPVIINEVHARVFGDANGDGVVNDGDEFVEIINPSTTTAVDLAGYTLHDGSSLRFTFPTVGSLLTPKSAFVVFGGGTMAAGAAADKFGTARVFKAAGLDLNDDGDVVQLSQGGVEKAGMVYWPYPGGSNTLDDARVLQTTGHSLVTGADGRKFSPGATIEGGNFSTAGTMTLTRTPASVSESADLNSVTLDVTLDPHDTDPPGTTTLPAQLHLTATEGLVFENGLSTTTVTVPASGLLAVKLTPVRDFDPDNESVTVSGIAAGFVDATSDTITVTDTQEGPLLINEVNASAGDAAQFIEILNTGATAVNLSNYTLHNKTASVFTFASSTCPIILPGQAFLVYGNAAVVTEGVTAALGSARVFKAPGALGLTATDLVRLKQTAGGEELAGMAVWPYAGGGSNSLDDSDSHEFVLGSTTPTPGTMGNSGAFLAVTGSLTFQFTKPCLSELALPSETAQVTVRRTGDPIFAAEVCLAMTQGGTLGATTVTIAAGSTDSPPVSITAARDADALDAPITISTITSGYRNSSSEAGQFVVKDTGTPGMTLELSTNKVVESAGTEAIVATITVTSAPSTVTLRLQALPPASAGTSPEPGLDLDPVPPMTVTTTVNIPASGTVDVAINAVNDLLPNGTRDIELVAIADAPSCAGQARTITVYDDGGLENGPFINEVEISPESGMPEFVELYVPLPDGASRSLDDFSLAIYDAAGTLTKAFNLDGSATNTAGLFVAADNVAAFAELNLDDTAGAVAVYQGDPPAALTSELLIDAFVYGVFPDAKRRVLLPVVTGGLWTAGPSVTEVPPTGTFASLGRDPAPVGAADLRNSSRWGIHDYATQGLSNTASAFAVWAGQNGFGLNLTDAELLDLAYEHDEDSDGVKELMEMVLGTDPRSAASGPGAGELDLPTQPPTPVRLKYTLSPLAVADTGDDGHLDLTIEGTVGTRDAPAPTPDDPDARAPKIGEPFTVLASQPSGNEISALIGPPNKAFFLRAKLTP